MACSGLALERSPLPEANPWRAITDPAERIRAGLSALYDWYALNAELTSCVLRDIEHHRLTQEINALRTDPLFQGIPGGARVRSRPGGAAGSPGAGAQLLHLAHARPRQRARQGCGSRADGARRVLRGRVGGTARGGRRLARRLPGRSPQSYISSAMRDFAALLDRLVLTPQRNVKLRLLSDYFRTTPDPDRGYALAALTGELNMAERQAGDAARARRRPDRRGAVPLFLRLCRRPRRDHRADLAGAATGETRSTLQVMQGGQSEACPPFRQRWARRWRALPTLREGPPRLATSSSGCCGRRGWRGRGWSRAGSTRSTRPVAGP